MTRMNKFHKNHIKVHDFNVWAMWACDSSNEHDQIHIFHLLQLFRLTQKKNYAMQAYPILVLVFHNQMKLCKIDLREMKIIENLVIFLFFLFFFGFVGGSYFWCLWGFFLSL